VIVHDAPQGTPEWHAARLGLPTASMAANLVTPTGRAAGAVVGYADRLGVQRYRGLASDRFAGSPATGHGLLFEARARAAYAWLGDVDVLEVGFCTDDRARYGGSPDGLIGEHGGLEIKCPLMPAFIAALMHIEERGTPPSPYLPQVHMLMLVTDRLWWDVAFWHPDLPDEPAVVRIERDRSWDRRLLRQIAVCRRRRDRVVATLARRAGRERLVCRAEPAPTLSADGSAAPTRLNERCSVAG